MNDIMSSYIATYLDSHKDSRSNPTSQGTMKERADGENQGPKGLFGCLFVLFQIYRLIGGDQVISYMMFYD